MLPEVSIRIAICWTVGGGGVSDWAMLSDVSMSRQMFGFFGASAASALGNNNSAISASTAPITQPSAPTKAKKTGLGNRLKKEGAAPSDPTADFG